MRQGRRRVRAFSASAKVRHRCCSLPLQRVITDFGADGSFAQAMDKVVEHYGVLLSETTIRRITEFHAQAIFDSMALEGRWPDTPGVAVVVAEMDGGMVPTVEPDLAQPDQRKGKRLQWKEAKICMAHALGSRVVSYGGTLRGDVDQAGAQLFHCAREVGFGTQTRVHAVGDGAEWIATQVEHRFGANGGYLVDFYHVCEYLSAASKALCGDELSARRWLNEQKARLKAGAAQAVIAALAVDLEAPEVADAEAPVRQCHRYLNNRLDQLNYQGAIAQQWPIGSGEIESAHRYVVQQRLKRPGAWWLPSNAEYMLALRLNRANRRWHSYWPKLPAQAA